MGVAAEYRGSRLIRRQIKEQDRPVEFELMERFNAVQKDADAKTPWGNPRIAHGHGGWWLYCPVTGFGYWYRDIPAIMRRWNVRIVAVGAEYETEPIHE